MWPGRAGGNTLWVASSGIEKDTRETWESGNQKQRAGRKESGIVEQEAGGRWKGVRNKKQEVEAGIREVGTEVEMIILSGQYPIGSLIRWGNIF